MPVWLEEIVPWGRLRREYELMFNLSAEDMAGGVLDCAGGPASFTAELAAEGTRVVAVDPIYKFSGEQIRQRFNAVEKTILSNVHSSPEKWLWDFHGSPDGLLANRHLALNKFLDDYNEQTRQERYLAGELPSLPFKEKAFGLAVCSHLLFLYSDLLDEKFHLKALRELCRVAREARIFPLLDQAGEKSPHLAPVLRQLKEEGFNFEVAPVKYRFWRGADEMLRISR